MSEFSHKLWRERYDAEMARAERIYSDLLDALHRFEVPATIEQTGGMSLGITWKTGDGGYWLLTDIEGPLPWDRDEVSGWALGRYDADSEALGECSTTDETSVGSAVALVLTTVLGPS